MVSWRNALLAFGMLLSGCINTISKKAQNKSSAIGWNTPEHKFVHPWFQTIIMFIGEALCVFGFIYQRQSARKKEQKNIQEGNAPAAQEIGGVNARIWQPILILPTFLDLLGTSFGGIGLVYCAPSIWQMLRGSIIIFTGLLSWIFLKRKLKPFRWFAICFTIIGLVAVGCSSYLDAADHQAVASLSWSESESESLLSSSHGFDEPESTGLVILGICFILLGQLVAACQMVVEEKLLKKHNLSAMHIVGMEGSFGFLAMLFIVLPLLFFIPGEQDSPLKYKVYENSIDAILQMYYNWRIALYGLLYCLSIAFYNFFGLSVTKHLTCVHRTLIDACRTIFVWAFELCIGGEVWTRWSYLELGGFAFLIIGTLLYNSIIKLPFFSYEEIACPALQPKTVDEKQPLLADKSEETKQ